MEYHIRLRILMFLLIFVGPCFAQNISDWSCNFNMDKCGIIEEHGTWVINETAFVGQLVANFNNKVARFSLPFNTTSAKGKLSFKYRIHGRGQISVARCKLENETDVIADNSDLVEQYLSNTTEISYLCQNSQNVQIKFIAHQTHNILPTISVDDIMVTQIPYTAPSPQSSTDLITTNSTYETDTSANREDELSSSTDNLEAPTTWTTPPRDLQDDRPTWILPVAATLGSFVAVIGVTIPVLCYCRHRNRATKTKSSLVNVNGSSQADSEMRYSIANQPSDLVYYADIRDDQPPLRNAKTGRKVNTNLHSDSHLVPKSSAAADFKVNDPNSPISSNLVKNPVYDGCNQIPNVSNHFNAEINDPVYEEAPDSPTRQSFQLDELVDNPLYGGQEQRSAAEQGSLKQPKSHADSQGLVDNPLYGGQDQGSRVQDSSKQAGSADSDGLVDNPLFGGQRSASHASNMPNMLSLLPSLDDLRSNKSDAESSRFSPEQGLSTQPEYAAVDDLIDNPLYGSQNDKPTNDGVTLQNESRADELIDNPLYGAQSTKPDGLASNLTNIAPTEELVDNPLYGDGRDRPDRQGVTSQTGMEPTDELIDNPLFGSQNESSAIGISRQVESDQSHEMTDNPLYGANS